MSFIFVDIDTQHDFMDPRGALYVQGAEALVPSIRQIYALAEKYSIPVVATMDSHVPADPEFSEYNFPPHCVKGTDGWRKIAGTVLGDSAVVTREGEGLPAQKCAQLIIEKIQFSVFTNPHAEALMLKDYPAACGLGPGEAEYVVFGVATDYCVKAAALGLAERGAKTWVVLDAIAAVDTVGGQRAIEEMKEADVKFIRTADVPAFLTGEEVSESRGC